MGYSAGGYGAAIIGLHHPRTFAAIQSWSGYFHPANTSLQRALMAAGVEHLFRLSAGGHTNALWQAHAPAWLALAVDSLIGVPTL